MKKYISLAIIILLAVSSLGQVAYAKDSNGENEGHKNGAGRFFSGLFQLKGGISNDRNSDDQNKNRNDDNDNNRMEDRREDRNDDRNDNNLPRAVSGVAKVTAVSGNTITAVTDFRSNIKTWTISTDANTAFSIRTGGTTLLSNVHVGDLIGFTGTLTGKTDSSLSVNASKVRVWGDVDLKARVVATGTVTSIDASSTQFTIVGSNGNTTLVNSTDLTRIKDANNNTSAFANITTGMTVKVKGFWNSLRNIITAVKVRIL